MRGERQEEGAGGSGQAVGQVPTPTPHPVRPACCPSAVAAHTHEYVCLRFTATSPTRLLPSFSLPHTHSGGRRLAGSSFAYFVARRIYLIPEQKLSLPRRTQAVEMQFVLPSCRKAPSPASSDCPSRSAASTPVRPFPPLLPSPCSCGMSPTFVHVASSPA